MVWPFSSSGSTSTASSSASAQSDSPFLPSQASGSQSMPQPQPQSQPSASSSSSSPLPAGATFDRTPTSSFDASYAPTSTELLLNPTLDAARFHPMAGLGKDDVEYLDIVDAQPSAMEGARTALPSRGWSDDLCYGTGTTYLSGLAIGGMLGAREGFVRPLGVTSPTLRLRLNAILNQVTRRGSFMGNTAGVIALTYNVFDALIDAARGKHDMAGSIAAGGLSGALFKCTAGPRAMVVASSIMMGAAATWSAAKEAIL